MTNEEKILLVLEMLGVDSVAKAKKELTELNKALDETAKSTAQARGGKGGKNSTDKYAGLLDLAYAADDLQYGLRGIVNNIPRLAQQFATLTGITGAAGFAGAATLAAVAINQLTQRHPEWFEWSEKVKTKLGELTDAIKAEEAAIKRQREEIDKLKESESKRAEDLINLIQKTEQLKNKEEELNRTRQNIKAGEAQAADIGKTSKDELTVLKETFQKAIVEPGNAQAAQDEYRKARLKQLQQEGAITEDVVRKQMAKEGLNFDKEVYNRRFQRVDGKLETVMPKEQAERLVYQEFAPNYKRLIDLQTQQQAQADTSNIFGQLQTARTPQEFQNALKTISRLSPNTGVQFNEEFELDKLREGNRKFLENQARGQEFQDMVDAELIDQRQRAKLKAEKKAAEDKARGQDFQDMVDWELIAQREAATQKTLNQNTQDANIRNTVLGQFDPLTMAIFRRQQAGTGRDAQRNLAALESRDVEFYSQALVTQGMDAGRARVAAMESLRGGESSFQQMAAGMGLNVRNVNQGFEASVSIMERLMQENEEQKIKTMMLMQRLNIMDQGNGAPARPQMNRVPR